MNSPGLPPGRALISASAVDVREFKMKWNETEKQTKKNKKQRESEKEIE